MVDMSSQEFGGALTGLEGATVGSHLALASACVKTVRRVEFSGLERLLLAVSALGCVVLVVGLVALCNQPGVGKASSRGSDWPPLVSAASLRAIRPLLERGARAGVGAAMLAAPLLCWLSRCLCRSLVGWFVGWLTGGWSGGWSGWVIAIPSGSSPPAAPLLGRLFGWLLCRLLLLGCGG